MRHKLSISTIAAVLVAMLAMATSSCRSPLSGGGSGSLSISLGGVLPPAAAPREASASGAVPRLILPSTASLRVRVQGEGVDKTQTATAASQSVTVSGLVPGSSVTVIVDALSPQGTVLTSWTGAVQVGDGQTPVAAILKPIVAPTPLEINETNYAALGSPTLAYGEAAFYDVTVAPAIDGEQQILFDTGKARWAWLGVYDADWEPLTPVASDRGQGWVVLDLSAYKSFKLVLSNAIASPGYPAGPISGTLASRRTVFFSPGGTGIGTSASPRNLESYNLNEGIGRTLIFSDGVHKVSPTTFADPGIIRLHGGFMVTSWNQRTGTTTIANEIGNDDTLVINNSGISGLIDRITIQAGSTQSNQTARALYISSSLTHFLVINDCKISGNVDTSQTSAATESMGIAIVSGRVEIASSLIHGGYAYSTSMVTTTGINVGNGANVYLHSSLISGGLGQTSDTAVSNAIYAPGGGSTRLTVVGTRLWGGDVRSTAIEAHSRGVFFQGGAELILANSIISGGHASCALSGPFTHTTALELQGVTPSMRIVGTTLDSGSSTSVYASTRHRARGIHQNTTAGSNFYSTALFNTDIATTYERKIAFLQNTGYTTSSLSHVSSFAQGAWSDGSPPANSFDGFTATSTTALSSDPNRSGGEEFRRSVAPVETYEQFLAQDWRPAAGALYVGKPGAPGPFSPEELTAYPALGLDLAGRPRPAVWAVGAFEP